MGRFFLVEFILNLFYTGEDRGIMDEFFHLWNYVNRNALIAEI